MPRYYPLPKIPDPNQNVTDILPDTVEALAKSYESAIDKWAFLEASVRVQGRFPDDALVADLAAAKTSLDSTRDAYLTVAVRYYFGEDTRDNCWALLQSFEATRLCYLFNSLNEISKGSKTLFWAYYKVLKTKLLSLGLRFPPVVSASPTRTGLRIPVCPGLIYQSCVKCVGHVPGLRCGCSNENHIRVRDAESPADPRCHPVPKEHPFWLGINS